MKKSVLIVMLFAFLCACQQSAEPVPVDIDAEKATLNELFDQFNVAFNAEDVETLTSFFSEDLLGCGSAPSQFFNKQEVKDLWIEFFANSDSKINLIGGHKINFAPDGYSAIVVDEYMFPIISPKIAWRNVYQTVKIDGKWKIIFFSATFIPKDEDIPKLNKALE